VSLRFLSNSVNNWLNWSKRAPYALRKVPFLSSKWIFLLVTTASFAVTNLFGGDEANPCKTKTASPYNITMPASQLPVGDHRNCLLIWISIVLANGFEVRKVIFVLFANIPKILDLLRLA
jgi:hypothetical protein